MKKGNTPLSVDVIEERLDDLLGAVLSSRRTATEPANSLATLEREQQNFAIHWTGVIAKSNSEMAFQFVSNVSGAFELMDFDGVEQWIIEAMDVYDRQGLYPGSAALKDVEKFERGLSRNRSEVKFDQIAGVMDRYVKGVSGRHLGLKTDNRPWTDTEILYFPDSVCEFDSREKNFQLTKAMGVYLWAQIQYGTFRVDQGTQVPIVCNKIGEYPDQQRALRIFEAVEEIRLLARIEEELPGLVRQMKEIRNPGGIQSIPEQWGEFVEAVKSPTAQVTDSLRVVEQIYENNLEIPEPAKYQDRLALECVRMVAQKRVNQEKEKFQTQLAMLSEGVETEENGTDETEDTPVPKISISIPATDPSRAWELQITIDSEPVEPPAEMSKLASSIMQDFGEIPNEYLVPAGDGAYQSGNEQQRKDNQKTSSENNIYYYNEWDFRRNHYRKNWCSLRILDMHPSKEPFVENTLVKYSHLITSIRRSFEALRCDDRLLRKQINGDDIDIDAVVESYVELHKGMEMSNRLFTQSRRLDRDLAVVFMVDVSGSTKGWINDAERESLVLLCEALEILRDRYAIYGFSGMTRKRCELYRIKTFNEPYNLQVKERIAGIRPQDYTRMGVIIRHLTKMLLEVEAKTRLLITLSDGKPDDYDGYRGEYGIKDTRQALMEAKHAGIHPFCITIDTQAHDYLSQMYGHVNYTVVSDVRKLPVKVSDIYRRLTT